MQTRRPKKKAATTNKGLFDDDEDDSMFSKPAKKATPPQKPVDKPAPKRETQPIVPTPQKDKEIFTSEVSSKISEEEN
jgi:hypothetical protein